MRFFTTAIIVIFFILSGVLFFCLYNKLLLVTIPSRCVPIPEISKSSIIKKKCTLWYWNKNKWCHDTKLLLWNNDSIDNATYLVMVWLTLLDEEGVLLKKSSLQSACFADQELIISFDRLPFNKEFTTYDKVMILESLLKTFREAGIPCNTVRFLIHHQPATDSHIDFARPWPLSGYAQQPPYESLTTRGMKCNNPITIMLDPAGDAQHTGRLIEDTFERGLTLQCAEAIKKNLERTLSKVRVILTRLPGETVEPLQNANFSNQLQSDLYISIHFYHTLDLSPSMYIYYYLYDIITDSWQKKSGLSWTPYYHAHHTSLPTTQSLSKHIQTWLTPLVKHKGYHIHAPFGCPVKSLQGVLAPAIMIEIGLPSKKDWVDLVHPFCEIITSLIATNS